MKLKKIVVGIDFSDYSEVARLRALELAIAHGAEVIYVHALDDADYRPQKEWLQAGAKFEELLADGKFRSKERMNRLAEEDRSDVLEIHTEISELEPAAALIDAAERHEADLVVIGTHGRTGFERLTLARTAVRVVRNSPCSVLVARAAKTDVPYMSKILVPTDFSEPASAALKAACSLVAEGGRVDVGHYWIRPFYALGDDVIASKSVALDEDISRSVGTSGAKLLLEHKDSGVDLHFFDVHDTVAKGVHDTLEATPYDMVIMGSHGRQGLERFFLGSSAEAVLRHANCSVMVVR